MSVFKRGRVYWYRFKWTLRLPDGARESYLIQHSARTRSKLKAGSVEEEHRHALRLGQVHPRDPWPKPSAPESPSVREFTQRFLQYAAAHTKRGTARFYAGCVKNLLRFSPLADCNLSNVSDELATNFAQWRLAFPKPPSILRVNGELRTLRRILHLAHGWGMIKTRPSVIHELPGGQGRTHVVGFVDEAKYLHVASPTLRDLAALAVDTGLRPNSELFPLEWKNVRLIQSDDTPQGFLHVAAGKSEAAVRNVPLTARAREVLCRRQQDNSGSQYVFPGGGEAGHIMTVQHAHERAARKAGLAPFEFYCWRHTFGTRAAESGVDKFAVARLMGHSSPAVAERYYIHVTEPHVSAGFERFEAYRVKKTVDAFPLPSEKVQ
jgi:integrase